MKSFVRTVETGSFSAVARELATTQPTVSKQIAALEDYLGVRLLTRSTRHLSLTDEGARYYEHCRRALEAVEEADASVGERQKPSGLLHVNCPVTLGQLQITPRLPRFFERYPDIRIDMMMNDRFIDPVEEGVDLVIRVGELGDSSMVARRIGTTRRTTVATPAYLERAGEPLSPDQLSRHECIVYSRMLTGNEWHFMGPGGLLQIKVAGRFQVDNSAAIRQAVLAGLGIAVSPIWVFGEDIKSGAVKVILRDYEPKAMPVHALYPGRRYQPVKVRCFIDFLATEFRLDPWLSDYGL